MPDGRGSDAPSYRNGEWGRPNPARLNDTGALVRKGTYPETLKTSAYCGDRPCETPFTAENTFNRRSPEVCVAGPFGAGIVVSARHRLNGGGGRQSGSPDRNTSVPGNGNSLSGGIGEVDRSGRYKP